MTLPDDVLKAIADGPNMDERFNDEWRRRELFAKRIAEMAYTAGWKQGWDEAEPQGKERPDLSKVRGVLK